MRHLCTREQSLVSISVRKISKYLMKQPPLPVFLGFRENKTKVKNKYPNLKGTNRTYL
jgi:hypothetical protein